MSPHPSTRALCRPAAVLAILSILVAGAPASAQTTHDVSVLDTRFVPPEITIQKGDSVTWTSPGTALQHNVRAGDDSFRCADGCDGMGGDGTQSIGPWSFTLTFDEEGDVPYYCELHGVPGVGMAGVIHVEGAGGAGTGGPGQLRLVQTLYQVTEADGTAMVAVERVGGSGGQVSAQLTATGGSATEGADFMPVAETVTFGGGETGPVQVMIPILQDGEDEGAETLHVELSGPTGGAGLGSPSQADVAILDDEGLDSCDPDDPLALCLGQGGRFKVQVSFRNEVPGGGTTTDRGDKLPLIREVDGEIQPVLDSGLFTFFDPNNAELLIKVLNTCSFSDRIWVFYAATTNVEFTLTVTDTEHQEVYFRSNPLGQVPETVLDTQAFETCP